MAVTLKQEFLQILVKITWGFIYFIYIFKNIHASAVGDLYPDQLHWIEASVNSKKGAIYYYQYWSVPVKPTIGCPFSTHCSNLFKSLETSRLALLLSHILAFCQYFLYPDCNWTKSQFLLTVFFDPKKFSLFQVPLHIVVLIKYIITFHVNNAEILMLHL